VIAVELVDATLGMIGGQYRDITDDDADLEQLHRLKTGRLFVASVRMGLEVAGVLESEREPWLAFADDVGLLFQVVDDVLDEDGFVERIGRDGAEQLAEQAAARAHAHLERAGADTTVLGGLVDVLVLRTG
jgi:geranylgeranyl diphosphate synthase type II